VATLLRSGGYMVSKINDDATVERISGAQHVDGVVVELPALAAITLVRRMKALPQRDVVLVVISAAPASVRRALPSVRVIGPEEVDDDLVSAVDLALVAHPIRRTG